MEAVAASVASAVSVPAAEGPGTAEGGQEEQEERAASAGRQPTMGVRRLRARHVPTGAHGHPE